MKSIKELISLSGRTALITGGAGHVGYAISEALAESGCDIFLLDINQELAGQKAEQLSRTFGVHAYPLIKDLSDDGDIRFIPQSIAQTAGRLDIIVHCAALVGTSQLKGWAVAFAQQDVDTFRQALEVNLTSCFQLTQMCLPLLKASKKASIINIASIYGVVGPDMGLYEGTSLGNPAGYSASKGGLVQLTRWMATSLAPDIRVNAISIGGIYRGHQDPFLSRYTQRTPLKRMAKEEDLKGAALYLASDLSAYVTGHNLMVDGGWTAW
jgi:NAD(P)-dependent dehydrogenase (short-subunit alcohol dehydrogenase family)